MKQSGGAALVALIIFLQTSAALAEEAVCRPPYNAERVVECALVVSPEVQISLREFDALQGRRMSAGIWLPSNPTISFDGGDREFAQPRGASAFNWIVTLSQEVEVAGQRGLRVKVANTELEAQARRTLVTELEVASNALAALFQLQAAREEGAWLNVSARSPRHSANWPSNARAWRSLASRLSEYFPLGFDREDWASRFPNHTFGDAP
jgi:hypothetical protein